MSFEAVPCVLRNQDGHPMYGLLIRPSQQTFIVQTGPNGSSGQVQLVPTNTSAALPAVSGNKLLLPPANATVVQSSSAQQFATVLTQSGNSVLRTCGSTMSVGQSKTLAPSTYPSTGALANNNPVFIPASTVQQYQQLNQRVATSQAEQVVPHSPGSEALGPSSSNASVLQDAGSPYGLHMPMMPSASMASESPYEEVPPDAINAPEPFDLNHHDFSTDDNNPMFAQSMNRTHPSSSVNNGTTNNGSNSATNELNSIFECLGARDLADLLSQSEAILSPDCGVLLDDATVDATTATNSFTNPSHGQQPSFHAVDFSNSQPQQRTSQQHNYDGILQPNNDVIRAPCRYQSSNISVGNYNAPPAVLRLPPTPQQQQRLQQQASSAATRQWTYQQPQSSTDTTLQIFPHMNDTAPFSMQAPGRLLMPNGKVAIAPAMPQMSPHLDIRSTSRASSSQLQHNPPSASSYEPISDTEIIHLPATKNNTDRKRHSSSSSSDNKSESLRHLKKRRRKTVKTRGRFVRASGKATKMGTKNDFDDMPMLEAEAEVESKKTKPALAGDSPGAATSTDSDGGTSMVALNNEGAQTSPISPVLSQHPTEAPKLDVSQIVTAVGAKFDQTCMKVLLKESVDTSLEKPSVSSCTDQLQPPPHTPNINPLPVADQKTAVENLNIVLNSADPSSMVEQIMKTLPPDQLQQFTKLFAMKLSTVACSSQQQPTVSSGAETSKGSEPVHIEPVKSPKVTVASKKMNIDRLQDQAAGYQSDTSSITSTEFTSTSASRPTTRNSMTDEKPSISLADIRRRQMMLKLQAYRNKARNIVDPTLIETILVLAGRVGSIKIEDFVTPLTLDKKRTCFEPDWAALENRLSHKKEEKPPEVEEAKQQDAEDVVGNGVEEEPSKFDNLQNIEAEADSDEDRSFSPELAPLVMAESPQHKRERDAIPTPSSPVPPIAEEEIRECKTPLSPTRSGSSSSASPLVQIHENEGKHISLKINLGRFKKKKSDREKRNVQESKSKSQKKHHEHKTETSDVTESAADEVSITLPEQETQPKKTQISECPLPPKKRIRSVQYSNADMPPSLTVEVDPNAKAEMTHTLVPPILESFAPPILTDMTSDGPDPFAFPAQPINKEKCLKMTIKTVSFKSDSKRPIKKRKKRHSAYPWERKHKRPTSPTKSTSPAKFSDKVINGLDYLKKRVSETFNKTIAKKDRRLPRKSTLKHGPIKECPVCHNMARFPPPTGNTAISKCMICLKQDSDSTKAENDTPLSKRTRLSDQSPDRKSAAVKAETRDLSLSGKLPSKHIESPKKRVKQCKGLPRFNPDNIPVAYLNSGGFKLPYDVWYEQRGKETSKDPVLDPSATYKRIRTNIYIDGPKSRTSNPPVCSCKPPKSSEEVACGEDCLNRKLYVECSASWCACKASCSNQRFQKLHWASGLQKFDTQSGRGFGVKTTRPLAEGSFICEYVGEVVSSSRFADRMSTRYDGSKHHYALNLDSGYVIDAYTCGSIARFVNHSCQPNCEIQKWSVNGLSRMGIFALRDIKPSEELTYNYKFLSFNAHQKCLCGQEKCSGGIGKTVYKERGRKKEIGRCSKQSAFFIPKQIALSERCTLRPLSHRERVFTEKRRVFMLRNVDKIRAIANKKRTDMDSSLNEKEFLHTQLTALKTSRSMSTRCLTKSTKNEGVTKIVQLAQVLHQIYTLVLTSKDSYGSHYLPKLNGSVPEKCKKRNSEADITSSEAVNKLPRDFGSFGAYILSGAYQTLASYERDMKKFLDPDAKSSRVVSKDLTILEGLQEQYEMAKREYLEQLKEGLAFEIPEGFVQPLKTVVQEDRPRSRLSATTLIATSSPHNIKDELLTTTADLSYLEASTSVAVGSYDPDICPGLWPVKATSNDSVPDKVRCSCGYHDENGLMVQCDSCLYWQHADCLHPKSVEADPFYCDVCKESNKRRSLDTFPVRDVLLVPEPSNRLKGCTYYRALLNPQNMQVRLGECVYVLKLINDDHKLALKRLHDECVGEEVKDTASAKRDLSEQSAALQHQGMDTTKHYNRADLRMFRVERLFKDPRGQRFVFGFYYARPHETFCEPTRRFYNNELFCTPLYDTLPVDAVVGRCLVMDANNFCRGRPKWPLYREEDIFICELRVDKAQRLFEKMSTKSRSSLQIPPYLFRPFPARLKIKREFTPFILPNETSVKSASPKHESLAMRSSYSSDEDLPLVNIKQKKLEANKVTVRTGNKNRLAFENSDKNQRLKDVVTKIMEKKGAHTV